MKRIYERKSITNKERTEIKRLSNQLPIIEGLGIDSDYHVEKIQSIILGRYEAVNKEDRDRQTSEELAKYTTGIFDLYDSYLIQEEKGFEPEKFELKELDYCYKCESKSVAPISDDDRYACNKCGAIHVPYNDKMNVFFVEEKKEDAN